MIVVRLEGGLGNIMFEYATGRAIALRKKVPLKFEVSSCWVNPLGDYSLSLEAFNIDIQNNLITEKEHLQFKKYAEKSGRRNLLFNMLFADRTKYLFEGGFDFQPKIHKIGNDVFLHGWWQNEKYFADAREQLLKDFTLKLPLSAKNAVFAQEIQNSNAVSLHIRRLDYVNNPKTKQVHGSLDAEYYNKALSIISEKAKDITLFVFSDDIPWVKENMRFPFKTYYIDGNMDKPHEDVHLMSLCKHHVVANSSFSWWGAWLGTNPTKIVIAPVRWTNIPTDHNDRVPTDWIKI